MSLTDLTFKAHPSLSRHGSPLRLLVSTDATSDLYTSFIDFTGTWERLVSQSFTLSTRAEPASELLTVAEVREEIGENFAQIEAIDSIFLDIQKPQILISIFLNTRRYDDSLMDVLLERELNVLDRFPNLDFDFQYIPLLGRSSKQFVPTKAVKVL